MNNKSVTNTEKLAVTQLCCLGTPLGGCIITPS